LILFCRAKSPDVIDGVTVVPIEEVVALFQSSPTGPQWFAQLT
jgi:hypothetical protein